MRFAPSRFEVVFRGSYEDGSARLVASGVTAPFAAISSGPAAVTITSFAQYRPTPIGIRANKALKSAFQVSEEDERDPGTRRPSARVTKMG